MARIRLALAALVAMLLAVWAISDPASLSFADSRATAAGFTQITGILSIGMMAVANLISIRPRWLEPPLDGLDKMYRLHKWLGIGGVSVGIVHWLTATGEGPRGAQHGRAAAAPPPVTDQTFLDQWHGLAHSIAQPVLFLLIALVAVALIRAIPYRAFVRTHILVMVPFLALAFHSVVLMKAAYWTTAAGWLTAALIAVGTLAGLWSVLRYFTGRRGVRARVVSAEYYPELHVLETWLALEPGWRGHRPGQFAFVRVAHPERAHPFTIASHWDPADPRVGFIAKELGDHTAKLRQHFTEGAPADIEGPYGRFTFDDDKPRQIWVGGGIGITPFVAKMRELAGKKSDKLVDLFHCTEDVSELALSKMTADAERAGVRLHILKTKVDGLLDFERVAETVPEWRAASVWFCGPSGFGLSLRRAFVAHGLAARDFHQELFQMR